MNAYRRVFLCLVGLLAFPVDVLAVQDTQEFTITVKTGAADGALDVSPASIEVSMADDAARQVSIKITCDGFDCSSATAGLTFQGSEALEPVADRAAAASEVSFTFNREVAGRPNAHFAQLTVGDRTGRIAITRAGQEADDEEEPPVIPVSQLLVSACTDQDRVDALQKMGSLYVGNTARFLITPVGNVLARPPLAVDEDDEVEVWVLGAEPLLSQLTVKRTSEFGVPGRIAVLGEGVDISVVKSAFEAQAAGQTPECAHTFFKIDDLAPGRGEVEIAAITALGKQTAIGEFDFGVNTLYSGAISLGLVYSRLGDPKFGLIASGTDSIITQTRDPGDATDTDVDGDRYMWGIFYHMFIPKRDVEKTGFAVSPVIGLGFDDIGKNFFVGGSLDGSGSAYVTLGAHLSRITDLDERSGFKLGDTFDGPSTAIPTVEDWRVEFFAAVSIDARAALSFLRAAVAGAGGG